MRQDRRDENVIIDARIEIPAEPKRKGPGWGWIIFLCFLPPLWPVNVFLLLKKGRHAYERKKLDDYRNYLHIIGDRVRVALSDVASVTGRSMATVRADLTAMASRGYLGRHAYVDRRIDVLILYPTEMPREEAPQYARSEPPRNQKPAPGRTAQETGTEAPRRERPAPHGTGSDSADFEGILQRMAQLNAQIRDEAVSKKIDRIGMLTSGILGISRMKPERAPEVLRFLDYYLPTTFKLLEMYAMIESRGYINADMKATMARISESLDLLITAFEKLQGKLFGAEQLDIDTDIDVLKTVLIRDGLLTPEGMDINSFRAQGGV